MRQDEECLGRSQEGQKPDKRVEKHRYCCWLIWSLIKLKIVILDEKIRLQL